MRVKLFLSEMSEAAITGRVNLTWRSPDGRFELETNDLGRSDELVKGLVASSESAILVDIARGEFP